MPWIAAAIGAGGSLLGGALGADAAGDAADAQRRAAREAQNYNASSYLTNVGLQEPWRQGGQAALNQLLGYFGLPTTQYQSGVDMARNNMAAGQAANTRLGAKAVLKLLKSGKSIQEISQMGSLKGNSGVLKKLAKKGVSAGDISMLQQGPIFNQPGMATAPAAPAGAPNPQFPPGYNFFREEGQRDLLGAYGAGGQGAFSGNALKGLSQWNQEYANQKIIEPLFRLATGGQGAASAQQNATSNYGQNAMMNSMNAGDARASGIANQGNMWGNALSGAGAAAGYGFGQWVNRPQFNGNSLQAQNQAYLDQQFPRYGS